MTEQEVAKIIGANLRRLRGRARQQDLAEVSGVSRQTIYNCETGRVLLSTRMLLHLAEALEVGLSEFFVGL